MTSSPHTVLSLVLLAGLAVGCRPAPDAVLYDFVERFPTSVSTVEARQLDFGAPEARAMLLEGWHTEDELWAGRTSFVWGKGRASAVQLELTAARPMTLAFSCRPYPVPEGTRASMQSVTVVVNDSTLATVPLEPGFGAYSLEVPEDALRVGPNRLEFRYAFSPMEVGLIANPRDPAVTVAWDYVRLGAPEEPAAASARDDAEGRHLVLPFRTRVDFFLEGEAGALLAVEDLDVWGGPSEGAILEVTITSDDAPAPTRIEWEPSPWWRPGYRAPLPAADGPMAISFYARPPASPPGRAGLRIVAPAIVGTAPPPAARAETPPEPLTSGAGPRPNILIYVIDTLRADHLGAYGYPLGTSPNLDALAADGILFENAVAQSSWTRTAIASVLTGLQPRSHAVNARTDKLSEQALSLPLLLQASGYETAGIVTNGNVSFRFGFDLGFDAYIHLGEQRTAEVHQLSDALNTRAFRWLDDRDVSRPFFLYLHATDPHAPYAPRSPFRERFIDERAYPDITTPQDLAGYGVASPDIVDPAALDLDRLREEFVALYDAEIAFNDHHFGRLVADLKARELYDSTMIVALSDHGEEFGDHGGWAHGRTLYQEQLAVPLVVKLPEQAQAGRVVGDLARHVDILPTVLDLLGLPVPPEVDGRSLRPAMLGEAPPGPQAEIAISYLELDGRELESIIANGRKLIRYLRARGDGSVVEWFDLGRDPGEQTDLSRTRPITAGYLKTLLDAAAHDRRQRLPTEEAVIDGELEERLRALGYIR